MIDTTILAVPNIDDDYEKSLGEPFGLVSLSKNNRYPVWTLPLHLSHVTIQRGHDTI
jgi:hypothetical protein